MQSIRDIGTVPYEAAPRGGVLRKKSRVLGGDNESVAMAKYALLCVTNTLTFIVLLVPILVRYVVRLFVRQHPKQITGQLALVTGGANGLGREICLLLARKGCHVAVADLDVTNGQQTVEELRKLGVKAAFFKTDISSYEAVQQMKQDIESSLGHVDILVNNAGVLAMMSIREGTPEDIKRTLEINLLSNFWTIRTFCEGMINRRKGHIVTIASLAALLPLGRLCLYVASKYGVRGLMEAFNDELYLEGLQDEVFTTTVYPCFINTRKDLINTLEKHDIIGRIPILSARTVARAVVEGMLRNRQNVYLPNILAPIMIQYENIPNAIQRLGRRILLGQEMPKLMD